MRKGKRHQRYKKGYTALSIMLVLILTIISGGQVTFAAKKQNKDYIYKINSDTNTVQIRQYIGSKKQVTIPKKIGGKKVTALSGSAFANTKVTKVTIPDSVTKLGAACFENCKQLRTITLPKKLKSIPYWTFKNCKALKTVTVRGNITKVGGAAFYQCEALTTVGNMKLDGIEYDAFYGCKLLTSSITFSEKCKEIPNRAFADCEQADITIPKTVTKIRAYAFANCQKLTKITVSEDSCIGVDSFTESMIDSSDSSNFSNAKQVQYYQQKVRKKFNMSAFAGCKNISEIEVSDSSGNLVLENGILFNRDKSVLLYVPATYAGTLDFLNTVKVIGDYAMTGYNGQTITIPDNLEEIREGAFYGANTSQVNWNSKISVLSANVLAYSGITELNLPEGVTALEENAISNCKSCKKVSFPKTLTGSNHDGEFNSILRGMSALEEVVVAAGNPVYYSKNGLLFKKGDILLCYPAAKKGNSYTVPKKVRLSTYCFDSLKYLKTIKICANGKQTAVSNYVVNCKGVTVSLPKSVTSFPSVGHSTDFPLFTNCTNCKALVKKGSKAHNYFKARCKEGRKDLYAYTIK